MPRTHKQISRGAAVTVSEMDGALSPRVPVIRPRVAFYSHDTMGLGHLRRNLLIAQTFASSQLRAISLLVAGMREANAFSLPPATDCLTLPALLKDDLGRYQVRRLDVSLSEVIAIRASVIRAAIEAFTPDVMIVDKVPRGAMGELENTLRYLRSKGHTYCILGLRDVLDDPSTVRKEWSKEGNDNAVAEYYDEVWVYGDPNVYDIVHECDFSYEVTRKVRFTGFLDQRQRLSSAIDPLAQASLEVGPFALCAVGGGQDGAELAKVFAQAELPAGLSGVIVTGSFMPPELLFEVRRLAACNPRMHVLGFVKELASLVRDAERLVIMGGYNSVCEALSFEKPTLIVPRIRPRTEQLIRAQALHALGLVSVLPPDCLNPMALTRWLSREVPRPKVHGRLDFNGLNAVQKSLESLMSLRRLGLLRDVG